MEREQVERVQAALNKRGFDAGPVDGKMGKRTERAIKAFQVSVGLNPDGRYGQLTEAAMFPESLPKRDPKLPTYPPAEPHAVVPSIPTRWPLQRDCMQFYGGVGLNQTTLDLPFEMRLAWDKNTKVRKITVHEKVKASVGRVLEVVAKTYSEREREDLGINLFGGSLNVRKMRGGSSYSMHSWGIALDFDPERNQLKWGRDKARLAKPDAEPFWKAWEAEGWTSLGRSRNYDWMHVQAARI